MFLRCRMRRLNGLRGHATRLAGIAGVNRPGLFIFPKKYRVFTQVILALPANNPGSKPRLCGRGGFRTLSRGDRSLLYVLVLIPARSQLALSHDEEKSIVAHAMDLNEALRKAKDAGEIALSSSVDYCRGAWIEIGSTLT
jgi:hypothetical protein